MMEQVSLETLPNVNRRDPRRDKKSVIESINHKVFKLTLKLY